MKKTQTVKKIGRKSEEGFSYLDVLVAITILSVGIVGLTGALLYGLVRSYESEQKLFAKQIAQSTTESVFVARDIRLPGGVEGWLQVGNVGNNPNPENGNEPAGIFVNGWHPIREEAGADGVIGTADDSCLGTGYCPSPTGEDNTSRVIPGYQRQIVIEDVFDPERPDNIMRRRITVTVRYQVGSLFREEAITTMIANLST